MASSRLSNHATTSANAIAVGPNGATNPTLKVNANTASAATGLEVVGAAAAGGLAVKAISSGTNENLTIDAKGSGTVTVNGTATGAISLARATGVTGALTVTSAAAAALSVGPNGATNPVLSVVGSVSSQDTGLAVTGRDAAAGASLAVISSGTNENLTIDAKGSGTIDLNATGTGNVLTPRAVLSRGATGGIGYATGAGGAQTQGTSKATTVTSNTVCGTITMHAAELAAGATVGFQLTNSAIAATDLVIVNIKSGGTNSSYRTQVAAVGAGSCRIELTNHTEGALAEAVVLSFAVIKGVAA
jgi:hypothetical protein